MKFSSGNAVYFWDTIASLLAVGLYTLLFKLLYNRFSIIGKIINFAISFLGAMTVYCMIIILAFIVFMKREEQLNEDR